MIIIYLLTGFSIWYSTYPIFANYIRERKIKRDTIRKQKRLDYLLDWKGNVRTVGKDSLTANVPQIGAE